MPKSSPWSVLAGPRAGAVLATALAIKMTAYVLLVLLLAGAFMPLAKRKAVPITLDIVRVCVVMLRFPSRHPTYVVPNELKLSVEERSAVSMNRYSSKLDTINIDRKFAGADDRAPRRSATGLCAARPVAMAYRITWPQFCKTRCTDSMAPRSSKRRAIFRKSGAVSSSMGRPPIQGRTSFSNQAVILIL